MRILNPKKSSGSSGVSVSESGDLSFQSVDKEGIEAGRRSSKGKVKKGKAKRAGKSDQVVSSGESSENGSKKEYRALYNKGIKLLSMREHSVKEIENKLSAKCERLDLISAVVEELLEKDYLSNDRFTESYVRAKQQRGFGPSKIRSELLAKDIKSNMIELYLNASSVIWYDNAENQYNKKYGDEPISDYNTWTKRARFMQSRGFTMEHIHSTLPQVESD